MTRRLATETLEESCDLLIETLYRPEHLNITASRGNKVDDDASTGMARGNSSRNTDREIRELGWLGHKVYTLPMCVLFNSFWQIYTCDRISIICQISNELTIVDDERDMRNVGVFNLNVVHHENFRRQLPHQSSSRASKPVKGGKLRRGIHVAMLQNCQI